MELKFTGIGAAYYPVLGSNCAFFEHGGGLYLIDCGESTFKSMYSRNEIYHYDKITVLITHLHADHIGSLGSFLSFCNIVLQKKIPLCIFCLKAGFSRICMNLQQTLVNVKQKALE